MKRVCISVLILSFFCFTAIAQESADYVRTQSGVDPTRVISRVSYSFLSYVKEGSNAQINNRLSANFGVNCWSFALKSYFISVNNTAAQSFASGFGDLRFAILNAFYVREKSAFAGSVEFGLPTASSNIALASDSGGYFMATPAIAWSYTIVLALVEKPMWARDKAIEENYYTIGTQAYIYSVNPFMVYTSLYYSQQIPYESYTKGVPSNEWIKMSDISNFGNSSTIMPNVNRLYGSTWLDLRCEPIQLNIPAFGNRYYSLDFQDAYMNYFNILGSRTIGGYGNKFAICGPDYSGAVPNSYTRVNSPTPLVWMVMRIAPTYINEKEIEECQSTIYVTLTANRFNKILGLIAVT